MYALPTVEAMFLKARDNKADVRPLLLSVGDNAARVYNLTQKLYKQHGLLDLPWELLAFRFELLCPVSITAMPILNIREQYYAQLHIGN